MLIEIFDVVDVNEFSLNHCDFCSRSEANFEDLDMTAQGRYPLREMYRLSDGCVICETCLTEGKDREEE